MAVWQVSEIWKRESVCERGKMGRIRTGQEVGGADPAVARSAALQLVGNGRQRGRDDRLVERGSGAQRVRKG